MATKTIEQTGFFYYSYKYMEPNIYIKTINDIICQQLTVYIETFFCQKRSFAIIRKLQCNNLITIYI